jgi:predicted acetyltransferase
MKRAAYGTEAVALDPIDRSRADVLSQLFELYAHDFSEHVPLTLSESGRFGVSVGELWWTRDDHHPFFVRVAGRLAGFALVRRGSQIGGDPQVMDVAEFFVVRGERRRRVGQAAAAALLARFSADWEVRVRRSNPSALQFWSRVLHDICASVETRSFSAHDVDWDVLRTAQRAL